MKKQLLCILLPIILANSNYLLAGSHSVATGTVNYITPPGPQVLDKTNHIPGSLGGTIDVSPSGATVYNIPVQILPGSNNVQPQLSIVYNSQGGYGLLGMGWTIAGLSAITRANKIPYYDGVYAGIELSSADGLALDGARLIENSPNIYVPANNPYSRIVPSGDGYELNTQDGNVIYFGTTSDSRFKAIGSNVTYAWAISKILTPDGNYIDYNYFNDSQTGESRISEIRYTGNGANAPYASIKFYYKNRADASFSYVAGKKIINKTVLNKITVNYGSDSPLIEYDFYYTYDLYTKLTKITLNLEGKTYNPTLINWGTEKNQSNDLTLSNTNFEISNHLEVYYGDFNGDGKLDAATWIKGSNVVNVQLNGLQGNFQIAVPMNENVVIGNITETYVYDFKKITILDWNNDGRDNILFEYSGSITVEETDYDPYDGFPYTYVVLYLEDYYIDSYTFNLTGFEKTDGSGYTIADSPTGPFYNYQFYHADLNRDGIINRIVIRNGSLFMAERLNVDTIPTISSINHIEFGDFDGNGMLNFITFFNSSGTSSSMWHYHNGDIVRRNFANQTFDVNGDPKTFMVGDFNGDGKSDYAIFNNTVGWKIFYSTGICFEEEVNVPFKLNYSWNPVVYWECYGQPFGRDCERIIEMQYTLDPKILHITDLNNDGKSDLIFARGDSLYINHLIGYDYRFYNHYEYKLQNAFSIKGLQSIDKNNTGQKSLLINNSTGSGKEFKYVDFSHRFDQNNFVEMVTDGMNNQVSIKYGVYKDNRQFGPAFQKPEHPVYLLRGPFLLTDSINTNHNASFTSKRAFSYEDAYVHAEGLGFLGFQKFSSYDVNSKTETISNFQYLLQQSGRELFTTLLTSQQVKKNFSTVTSDSIEYEAAGLLPDKNVFTPVPVISTKTDHVRNTTTQTVNEFDSIMGRMTKTETTTGDWQNTKRYNYELLENNLSRLVSMTDTKKADGDSVVFETGYTYDPNFRFRLFSKNEPGLTTLYNSHDTYGNITGIITIADSGDTLSVANTYDVNGRFLVSSTDAHGLTTTSLRRESDGRLISKTDPHLYITSLQYPVHPDKSVVKTILPGEVEHTRTLGWDQTGEGLFFIIEETDPGGYHITWFNSAGQKLKEAFPAYKNAEIEKTFVYNLDGTIASTQQTGFSPVYYNYCDLGLLESLSGPNLDVSYQYDGNTVTTSDNIKNIAKTEIFNEIGALVQVNSNSMGNISYEYNPLGQVTRILSNGNLTTMNFDDRGNQTQLNDPSAGTIQYDYNDFGQLISQTDAKNQTVNLLYDKGRLLSQNGPGMQINYTYSNETTTKGLPVSVSRNGITESYHYGDLNRLDSMVLAGSGKTFSTGYEYNQANRLFRVHYPSGLSLQFEYDTPGNIVKIFNAADLSNPVWDGVAKNQKQQWQEIQLGNNLKTVYSYDANDMPVGIATILTGQPDTLLFLEFDFNEKGQLIERREGSLIEEFSYDDLNRLTFSAVAGLDPFTVTYDNLGNITETTLAGTFTYDSLSAYRVIAVNNTAGQGQSPTLYTYTTYTADNKVAVMDNGLFRNEFIYGPSGNRFKVDHYENNNHLFSKIYVDNNEFVLDNAGNIVISRTFIFAPTGICAVYQDSAGVKELFYIHTDYLGSWLGMSDSTGAIVQKFSYDAWGRPRDPATWNLLPVGIDSALVNLNAMQPRFDRGYTGHEHMCGFGLINMNGRLYDPYLQRFLSPDPFIISPTNAQDYNRYSYVLNNPLMYTDPSGYSRISSQEEHEAARISFQNWWNNWTQQLDNPGGSSLSGNLTYNWNNGNYYVGNTPLTHYQAMNLMSQIGNFSIPSSDFSNFIGVMHAMEAGIGIYWMMHLGNKQIWAVTSTGTAYMGINVNSNSGFVNDGSNILLGLGNYTQTSLDNWQHASELMKLGSNMWGDGVRYTLSGMTRSDASIPLIKGIGTSARAIGYAGMAISLGIDIIRYYQNPTWGNAGRIGITAFSIAFSVAWPGPGTAIGFGTIALNASGAFEGFYNYLDVNQNLYNNTGLILFPSSVPLNPLILMKIK